MLEIGKCKEVFGRVDGNQCELLMAKSKKDFCQEKHTVALQSLRGLWCTKIDYIHRCWVSSGSTEIHKFRTSNHSILVWLSSLILTNLVCLLHKYKFQQHGEIPALVLFVMCMASWDWRTSMFPREMWTTNLVTYFIATRNSRLKVLTSTVLEMRHAT